MLGTDVAVREIVHPNARDIAGRRDSHDAPLDRRARLAVEGGEGRLHAHARSDTHAATASKMSTSMSVFIANLLLSELSLASGAKASVVAREPGVVPRRATTARPDPWGCTKRNPPVNGQIQAHPRDGRMTPKN